MNIVISFFSTVFSVSIIQNSFHNFSSNQSFQHFLICLYLSHNVAIRTKQSIQDVAPSEENWMEAVFCSFYYSC